MCIDVFDKICNNAEKYLREYREQTLVMKQNNYKPQLPDVMEAIFDAAYLIFDLSCCNYYFLYTHREIYYLFFMEY